MRKAIAMILAAVMLLSLAACGGSKAETKQVDLSEVYKQIEGTLPEMMLLDETIMLNLYGVAAEDCNQAIAAVCANGLRTDEVWLMEAKDARALEKLTALVNTRLEAKKDETVTYSPDQYAVVEKAVILTQGNYLVFLVSPDVDTLKTTVENALK